MSAEPRMSPAAQERTWPCSQCGAKLSYAPGTTALRCDHCGTTTALPAAGEVVEHDLDQVIAAQAAAGPAIDRQELSCQDCGAQVTWTAEQVSAPCPWCGGALAAKAALCPTVSPHAVLPFAVDRRAAEEALRGWLTSRWFAPTQMQALAGAHQLQAVWLPAWTFDAATTSHYSGQRGDDYWVSVSYQTTVNGRSVTRSRQERRTRWSSVSGTVHRHFDDVLVPAARSLPERLVAKLEPWPLAGLVPFDPGFLAGCASETARLAPTEAFAQAKEVMAAVIQQDVRSDIGGDHQRIGAIQTVHRDPTCKRILLPVWSAGYRLDDRTYTVLVNATTGEIQGERPWSVAKIAATVLAVIALIALIIIICRWFVLAEPDDRHQPHPLLLEDPRR